MNTKIISSLTNKSMLIIKDNALPISWAIFFTKIEEFFSNSANRDSLSSNLLNEKLFTYINKYAVITDSEKSTAELRKQK